VEEYVAGMREMRNVFDVLIGKPEGKRLCERRWRGFEDNIKMDLKFCMKVRNRLNWLTLGPMVVFSEHDNAAPTFLKAGDFMTGWMTISFLR
jgi:hypothetical protein